MTLEEFEKSLAEEKRPQSSSKETSNRREHKHRSKRHRGEHTGDAEHKESKDHYHRHEHHRHHHHHSKQHDPTEGDEGVRQSTRRKRSKLSSEASHDGEDKGGVLSKEGHHDGLTTSSAGGIKRDSWMQKPSTLDIEFVSRSTRVADRSKMTKSTIPDAQPVIHQNDIKLHPEDVHQDHGNESNAMKLLTEEADYTFGDAGSLWRMTKLKGVSTQAEASGLPVETIAVERYGTLRAFDVAMEEQTELDRREMYGKGYVGKDKPTGDLFRERQKALQNQEDERHSRRSRDSGNASTSRSDERRAEPERQVKLDQTGLNRLKAQIMKARLRGDSNLATLEAEYAKAIAAGPAPEQTTTVVLGTMENRLLAGGRRGEVVEIDNKRGRERGSVKENEDMTIEDMVREERRTKGQSGGDGRRFAERIAKDGKFDNDHDYLDENASRLAQRVQRSEVDLKNIAINDYQRTNRILDACPLCHHEDRNLPPIAPIISLATRVYLTLPTDPEISEGGACIVPIQHRGNLLECDDDEWEEIRNFMKSLIRKYHEQGRDVIFYENAAAPQKRRHAAMEVVPVPYRLGEIAPAFFKEAMLTSDEEWTQHRKLIDTLARAKTEGLGKQAFRRSLAKEMPYFHVWFEVDGGLGHIVEDSNRWPKGDLFAREVLGGMLDVEPQIIKRQGRWRKGPDPRLEVFQKGWRKFDWTRLLTDGG